MPHKTGRLNNQCHVVRTSAAARRSDGSRTAIREEPLKNKLCQYVITREYGHPESPESNVQLLLRGKRRDVVKRCAGSPILFPIHHVGKFGAIWLPFQEGAVTAYEFTSS